LWLFREKLAKAGLIEKLFDRFDQHLAAKGYMARGGQIIDDSIVSVPTRRDSTAELQAGRTPAGWKQKPAKVRQKDRDARWTKKHGRSFFGYKNHVNADAKHKLIQRYAVTDAAVHDSQGLEGLLDCSPTALIGRPRSRPNSGPAVTTAGFIDAVGATIRCLWFGASASEPCQEPDTRSH
jgi:IS5 family transposase